ncbi:MAG: elongation factor P maturation arginine rhamnosyltransferase EarP [Burkholderiaceae bacterium]
MPACLAPNTPPPPRAPLLWDVFCRVIDNHGDLGVCWRLSRQLGDLGHRVRLWVDDASALAWMAPHGAPGVQVLPWALSANPTALQDLPPSDVWVEAFGCDIEEPFVANFSIPSSAGCQKSPKTPAWINLEYLTAEPYARRCHGLPSPVMRGPAAGRTKHFFYPGFTEGTGGLLREPDLDTRQARFDRRAWLPAHGVPWQGEQLASLFCYEPPALPALLQSLAGGEQPTRLLVTPGRPAQAVAQAVQALGWARTGHGALRLHPLHALPQPGFDELLWACDLNFVRGEDSLVRALWAGQPFIWHIYPQDDGAHWAKLDAFLDWLQAPADVRTAHHQWNGTDAQPFVLPEAGPHRATVQAARSRLAAQPDLVSQLLHHVTRP